MPQPPTPITTFIRIFFAFTTGLSIVFSAGIFVAAGVIRQVQSLPPTVRVVRGTPPPAVPQVLGETTAAPVDALIRGSLPAIYYAAADGFRYVFPNEKTFGSWFRDYGQIIAVSDEVLAQIPLKGNVTYRPGVRLVKLQTSPVVYVVDAGGTLRALPNEAMAAALYGDDWSSKVDDLPDVFFVNYREGEPIAAPAGFDPVAAVAQAQTINQDRGLPVTANAPVATTAVGSSTIPLPSRVIGRPIVPEPATATLRLPEGPAVPTAPTSTATSTPEILCPLGQTHDAVQRRCLPTHARDARCGANGYRDRFGGCYELPRGRFPVAGWAICGDKNCDVERGENGINCLADCPGIFPPGYSTSTPTTTPSGATPAQPATPATPAAPTSGSAPTTPATPATPATPGTPSPGSTTDRRKWEFKAGNTISHPAIGPDGTIYVVASSGCKLHALDKNGNQKWVFSPTAAVTCFTPPAVGADGAIYVGGNGVYAINQNGAQQWRFTTDDAFLNAVVVGSDTLYAVASNTKKVYALTLTGAKKWVYEGSDFMSTPALGPDGTLYVSLGSSSNAGSVGSRLLALNPDGSRRWLFAAGNGYADFWEKAIGADGTIYVGSTDGSFYAINPNGTKQWSVALPNGFTLNLPAVGPDGVIYVLAKTAYPSSELTVQAFNADGAKRWEFPIGANHDPGGLTIGADGVIYAGASPTLTSPEGKIFALDQSGAQRWLFTASPSPNYGHIHFAPVIDADGTLYASISTSVYAITSSSLGLAASPWPKIYGNNQNTSRAPGTPPADTTAPALINLAATAITETSATISWTTDEPSSSQVEYGPTINYGSQTTADQSRVTSHTVNLTGLTASTKYYYRVKSQDGSGNLAVGGSYFLESFTTLASPAPPQTTPTTTPAKPATVTTEGVDGTWCYDPDGAGTTNYYIAGYCQDSAGTYADFCDGGTVRDYYCTGTWTGVMNNVRCEHGGLVCPAGCANGACRR